MSQEFTIPRRTIPISDLSGRNLVTIFKRSALATDSAPLPHETNREILEVALELLIFLGGDPDEIDRSQSPKANEERLAREGLSLLRANAETRSLVDALVEADPASAATKAYGISATISIVAAAFIVLQTNIKIERNVNGGWKFHLEKKSIHDTGVRSFTESLIAVLQRKESLSETSRDAWQRKLEYLHKERAMVSNAEMKYELDQRILAIQRRLSTEHK